MPENLIRRTTSPGALGGTGPGPGCTVTLGAGPGIVGLACLAETRSEECDPRISSATTTTTASTDRATTHARFPSPAEAATLCRLEDIYGPPIHAASISIFHVVL